MEIKLHRSSWVASLMLSIAVSAWAQNPAPSRSNPAPEPTKKAKGPNPTIPESVEDSLPPHAKVLRVQGDRAIVRLSKDLVVQTGDVLILDLNWDFKKKELEAKLKAQAMGQNPMATPNPRKQSLSGLGSWSYSRTQVETGDPLVSDSTSYNVFDYRLAARWMWNFESFEVGPEIAASRSNQINPESFELEATSTWQTGLIAEYNFVGNRAERSFVPSLVAGGLWQRSAGSSQWGLSSGLGIKIFALGANTAFRADVLYQAWLVDPLVHAGVLQLGVQSYF